MVCQLQDLIVYLSPIVAMAKIFFIPAIAISKQLLFCSKLTAVVIVVVPLIHRAFMQVSVQFICSDLSKFLMDL